MEESGDWLGAPGELQPFGPRFTARIRLLEPIFRHERPERALDIGCGRGAVTRVLAASAGSVTAVEVTEAGVRMAAEALADVLNVQVRLCDLFEAGSPVPDVPGRPFDLVLLSEVLEHLEDDVAALARVGALLKDGGTLVLTVPRDPRLWSVEDELWGHHRRYLRDELLGKLAGAGFRPVSVWSWGFPFIGLLVRWQVRRLERRHRAGGGAGAPRLPGPLLRAARLAFIAVARFERLFRGLDRGVGYIVVARAAGEP